MDKIKSLSALTANKTLVAYIKEAMALNENGVEKVKPIAAAPKVIKCRDYYSEKPTPSLQPKKFLKVNLRL